MSVMARAPLTIDDCHMTEKPFIARALNVAADRSANPARIDKQRLLMPAKELRLLSILIANVGTVVRS